MDYSFLIGVHQVDAVPESPGVRRDLLFNRNDVFFFLGALKLNRFVYGKDIH